MRITRGRKNGILPLAAILALGGAPTDLPAGPLEDARTALDAGDHAEALRLLTPLARDGDPVAQRTLGAMYAQGLGVPPDLAEAERWLHEAAVRGDEKARQNLLWLAEMYRAGDGVPRDCARALAMMRGLVALGHLPATVNLGSLYIEGCGEIAADVAQGISLTRQAAERGDAMAQANLGACCALGLGVEQDYGAAMEWYRKAAEQGLPEAQFAVGLMYESGEGVPSDLDEARRWYRLAASQGEERAIARLAALESGTGAAPDPEPFLREAAREASAVELAKAYAFVALMQRMLPMAAGGATLRVGGQAITKENYRDAKADYDLRQRVYAAVIRRRGFQQVGGRYLATATRDCAQAQSMWARAVLDGRVREVELQQDGFDLRIIQHWSTGPQHALDATAAIVESSFAFSDPGNPDYYLLGSIADGAIALRPDVDTILSGAQEWVKAPPREALARCAVTLTRAK